MRTKQLLFLVLLLVTQVTFSQTTVKNKSERKINNPTTLRYEPIYFVLGTLSDYMGRFQYVAREKQVDRYYPYEKPLVDYLTNYIHTEMNLAVDTLFDTYNHCTTYSDELSKILNGFYRANGELINNKFETNKQICSFIAGVYYRYGDKLDASIYKIQLANSPKHQNCYDFLKRIGCKNILYKYLSHIPAVFILYFEPTDELKNYLDFIESDRLILQESYHKQVEGMMKAYKTKDEIEKDAQLSRKLEVEKIKNAFD